MMDDWEGVRGLLGLANRAGKLVAGTRATEERMLQGKVSMLILAQDLSPKSFLRFVRLAESNAIPWKLFGDKQVIGSTLGRRKTGILGVVDEGLARAIAALLSEHEIDQGGKR